MKNKFRLLAIITGSIVLALVLMIVIGHILEPDGISPTPAEVVEIVIFSFIFVGIIIGFKFDLLGASMSISAFILFNIVMSINRHRFMFVFEMMFLLIPAAFSLLSYFKEKGILK